MKGKKSDPEFIGKFIKECVSLNKKSTNEIIAEAKTRISEIDEKIKESERLKIVRSKLLDVVYTFDNNVKNHSNEIKLLPLYDIQRLDVCANICKNIENGNATLDLMIEKYSKLDVIFYIKKLLDIKVLDKKDDFFIKGEMFESFINLNNIK